MTVQNLSQEVAEQRPAVNVQNPVAGTTKDRRLFSVSLSEDGGTITNEAPFTQAGGFGRFEWDGPYVDYRGERFVLINVWANSIDEARNEALQVPQDLI